MGIKTEFTCDGCGIPRSEAEFELLTPIEISLGTRGEEYWEWYGKLLCMECLHSVQNALAPILKSLNVPDDHRHGSHDFYEDHDEWGQVVRLVL